MCELDHERLYARRSFDNILSLISFMWLCFAFLFCPRSYAAWLVKRKSLLEIGIEIRLRVDSSFAVLNKWFELWSKKNTRTSGLSISSLMGTPTNQNEPTYRWGIIKQLVMTTIRLIYCVLGMRPLGGKMEAFWLLIPSSESKTFAFHVFDRSLSSRVSHCDF